MKAQGQVKEGDDDRKDREPETHGKLLYRNFLIVSAVGSGNVFCTNPFGSYQGLLPFCMMLIFSIPPAWS